MEVRVLESFSFPKFTLSGENNCGICFLAIETLVKKFMCTLVCYYPCTPRDGHCFLSSLLSFSVSWELDLITSENSLSSLHQLKDAYTSMYLAGIKKGCRSKKQHSFCPNVQALRGVCQNEPQSIEGLCHLNFHCLTVSGKVPLE